MFHVKHSIPSTQTPKEYKGISFCGIETYQRHHIPSRTLPGSAKGISFCGIETYQHHHIPWLCRCLSHLDIIQTSLVSALDPDIPSRTQFLYFLRPPINPHKRPVFTKTKNRSSTFRLPWHESLFPHVLSYPYIRPNEANHES